MTFARLWAPVLVLALAVAGGPGQAGRATVTVAVAANFTVTAKDLAQAFTETTGTDVRIVTGATGALYAQILRGAPFDILLAADAERPALLQAEGRARAVRSYALGRLVLGLGPTAGTAADPGADPVVTALRATARRLAIANPDTAPYGRAAMQVLIALRGADWAENVVIGESVGQSFAFLATGNVPMALIAASQLPGAGIRLHVVPPALYDPIRQDAALLADRPEVLAFWDFLFAPDTQARIAAAGYDLPKGAE